MKKMMFVMAALVLVACAAAFSQAEERNEDKWASISYFNVPILKIYDARDGYAVVYQKTSIGTGNTVIPKSWAKGNEDAPRKLKLRPTTGTLKPFMTVVKKDGEFLRVILTVPNSRTNQVWGVLEYASGSLEGADKETLEDLPLF